MSSTARTVFAPPSPAASRATVREAPRLAIGTNPPGVNTPVVANQVIPNPLPGPLTVFLDQPAYVAPHRAAEPPRPSLAIAMLLALLAIAIAPLAPIAWMHAAEQLDLIRRGVRTIRGRRTLEFAQGVGIAMTMVAVAATAFGFTVLVVRFAL